MQMSDDQSTDAALPLELVATIAATLFAPHLTANPPSSVFDAAADSAVRLLDACQRRLRDDQEHRRSNSIDAEIAAEKSEELARLQAKFPDGMPWKNGLLFVTGRKSEAEAIVPFKHWRAFERVRRRYLQSPTGFDFHNPPKPDKFDLEDVENELNSLRQSGFVTSAAFDEKPMFRCWFVMYGQPEARSASGKKGAAAKKKLPGPKGSQK